MNLSNKYSNFILSDLPFRLTPDPVVPLVVLHPAFLKVTIENNEYNFWSLL